MLGFSLSVRPTARAIRRNIILVVFMAQDPTIPLPSISIRPEAIAWREAFWQRHSLTHGRVLVIAPGSGAVAKNWPENHFSAVAEWWRDRMNGSVVVLVGPVEEERGGFTALGSHGLTLHNLDLAKAAALLAGSSLYLATTAASRILRRPPVHTQLRCSARPIRASGRRAVARYPS